MLSDEEKKAIDNMKSLLLYSKEHEYFSPFQEQEIDDMNIVLNIIEKQSKEIEELKEDNKHQWEERCKLTFELENSTSNDKIKAKIEVLDKAIKVNRNSTKKISDRVTVRLINDKINELYKAKEVLQSLLEKE